MSSFSLLGLFWFFVLILGSGNKANGQDAALYFDATKVYDMKACNDPRHISLSFDDGPTPYTPELLANLKSKNVPGEFLANEVAHLRSDSALGPKLPSSSSGPQSNTLRNQWLKLTGTAT